MVNRTLAQLQRQRHGKRRRGDAHGKYTDADENEKHYYLEDVELHTVQCTFSFFALPSSSALRSGKSSRDAIPSWYITFGFGSDGGANPELLSASTQAIANAISSKTLIIANADDAHLRMTGLRITHCFMTMPLLIALLTKHYSEQLHLQLIELLGSSHVLGNPIGLLSNLGAGVFDLVNEPLVGAIKGPASFGRGVAIGMGSFVKYSVRGVANTASALIGTLGNASATLTADPEYLRKRKLGRLRQPKHVASGLMHGTRHLAKGVFDGVTGIFTKPVEGAMHGGAVGFFAGMGRGLLGTVVKPVVGALDAVATISDGIRNTTALFDEQVMPQRPPRILYGPDALIRPYGAKELSAACFLDTRGHLRVERHQRETYVDHMAINMQPSRQLLKQNEAFIKRMAKEREMAGIRTHAVSPPSLPPSPQSLSLRSNSDADMRFDSMSLPSSTNTTPRSMRGRRDSVVSTASSSTSSTASAPSLLLSSSPLTVAFVATDHSLVCLRLDVEGNLRASLTHSSTSSRAAASAASAYERGGTINSLIQSESAASFGVSKYAKVLWSCLWLRVMSIERTDVTHVTLRIIVSAKQARDMQKSDRVKSLFPFAASDLDAASRATMLGFSSTASYSTATTARTATAPPQLLVLQIPCNTSHECDQLESMLRLAHARSLAEQGGGSSSSSSSSSSIGR